MSSEPGSFAEVARRWRAQIAVNAGTWAACEALPEANHHAIAGLDWPDGFASKVMALFLTGQADHPRNAQRVQTDPAGVHDGRLQHRCHHRARRTARWRK